MRHLQGWRDVTLKPVTNIADCTSKVRVVHAIDSARAHEYGHRDAGVVVDDFQRKTPPWRAIYPPDLQLGMASMESEFQACVAPLNGS